MGAMPNFFCEDFLTFRDAPKCTDEATCDFGDPQLIEKIRAFQPPSLDVKGTIVAEETEVLVGALPRGTCNGSFVGDVNENEPDDQTGNNNETDDQTNDQNENNDNQTDDQNESNDNQDEDQNENDEENNPPIRSKATKKAKTGKKSR